MTSNPQHLRCTSFSLCHPIERHFSLHCLFLKKVLVSKYALFNTDTVFVITIPWEGAFAGQIFPYPLLGVIGPGRHAVPGWSRAIGSTDMLPAIAQAWTPHIPQIRLAAATLWVRFPDWSQPRANGALKHFPLRFPCLNLKVSGSLFPGTV